MTRAFALRLMGGMGTRSHPIRIAVLMLLGAYVGSSGLSVALLLPTIYGYDHGQGEGRRCFVIGAVVGTALGLMAEWSIRRLTRMPTSPSRFRFSLRTLFVVVTVVAVALGWLAWQARIVRERTRTLESIRSARGFLYTDTRERNVSSVRKHFGDHTFRLIVIPDDTFSNVDVTKIKATFPEAEVLQGSRSDIDKYEDRYY